MISLKRKAPAGNSSGDSLEELDSLLRQTTGGRPGGLGVLVMAMFVMGQSAGSGILALPKTMEYTGRIGFLFMVISGLVAAYTGSLLGKCWEICEKRYPELLKHTADPYATIGQKAAGLSGRMSVHVANNFAIFGSCVVYIILSAGLISDLTLNLSPQRMSTCTLVLILGACMIPLSWLGTPIDFWPVSYIASLTTAISCILISLNLGKAFWTGQSPEFVPHANIKPLPFFMGLGTMIYAFSGHMSFPTLQQDMKRRKDFWKSVVIAFSIITVIYLMVTLTSYAILGNTVDDNILATLGEKSPGPMAYTAQILIIGHVLSAYLIINNPLCQDVEKLFNIKNKFSLARVCVRTTIVLTVIFVAVSVPRFNAVMALVGGSALNLIVYILPVIFYECLCRRKGDWPTVETIPLHVTVFHAEIVLVVAILGVGATIASVDSILGPDTFVPPCYINMTSADT